MQPKLKSTLLLPLVIAALVFTSSAFAGNHHRTSSNSKFVEVRDSYHQGKKARGNTRKHNQHRNGSRKNKQKYHKKTHHKKAHHKNRYHRTVHNNHRRPSGRRHNYYRNHYHNRYASPYHSRRWKRGHRLHHNVVYHHVPYYAYYDLAPPPYGHHYVRVDNDILLMAITTGIVVDILFNYY